MSFILTLLLGIISALVAGAFSGIRIGKEALGAELAADMGGLYGFFSGAVAVFIGSILLAIF